MKKISLVICALCAFVFLSTAWSSSSIRVHRARLIIDNDASFDSKLEAIRGAQRGEEIRLAYYIYSADQSSSVFSYELLKASQRGVQVRLLVDLLTNYKNLDLFTFLEEESGGKVQVRFYGRPNKIIQRDSAYLTTPCPPAGGNPRATACSDYKWKNITADSMDYFSQLFLSGLYAKKAEALELSILLGQQIVLDNYTKGVSASEQEMEDLKYFFRLLYQAKIHDDPLAKIKVFLALQLHGERLNPILNELYGRLPIEQMGESSAREWEHLTDFAHHKLLLVGTRFAQLGGRNIENSYHMKENPLTEKYIFRDTDMAIDIQDGGEEIARAFDELWSFEERTLSLADVRQMIPNDAVENLEVLKGVAVICLPKPYATFEQRQELIRCLQTKMLASPRYLDQKTRLGRVKKNLEKGIRAYRQEYLPMKSYSETWRMGSGHYEDQLDSDDVSRMLLTYLENVPYRKDLPSSDRRRLYGVHSDSEWQEAKQLHWAWYEGLQNACVQAAQELRANPAAPEKRVVLHSAYFLPPSVLVKAFAKMMDGTWDCKNVRVTFLTNSIGTTDLAVINLFSRYQVKAFFEIYSIREGLFGAHNAQRSAKFDYFEYVEAEGQAKKSLHTKVSVLGDDLLVGSANADVRSYFMDTNNGFYLKGAKKTAKQYVAWVDRLLADPKQTRNLTGFYSSGPSAMARIQAEDEVFVAKAMAGLKKDSKLKIKMKALILRAIDVFGRFVVNSTRTMMSKDYVVGWGETESLMQDRKRERQKDEEEKFDRLLQVF